MTREELLKLYSKLSIAVDAWDKANRKGWSGPIMEAEKRMGNLYLRVELAEDELGERFDFDREAWVLQN